MDLTMKMTARFLKDEDGATAIEYAVIASAIFFAILTLIQLTGEQLGNLFQLLIEGFITVQS